MQQISRRTFLALSALGIGGVVTSRGWAASLGAGGVDDALYSSFLDPDRKYSVRPFWFWNGDLNVEELRAQMKTMIDHGVYGAYAHNRDGLTVPYLSDTWWKVLSGALDAAEELGFSLCMVDEFQWPSGEARDFSLPGPQKSRVVAANPDFHLKRLKPTETFVAGESTAHVTLPANTLHVLAAKVTGDRQLDASSITAVHFDASTSHVSWKAPAGSWVVITYSLQLAVGQPDRGTVDLMNRDAVAKYIEIYYEELLKRCGTHFGKALPATFADHEGTYGARYPWTPRMEATFHDMHGYDMASMLPALSFDIGARTEKSRCDFLDTVSKLYTSSFFQQVTDWCERHHLDHSGHIWEESLFLGAAYQGDFFGLLRAMSNPGCDTLLEWSRQSLWLKENASVADFEHRHVVCENQGVQGEESYLSPERMRRVTNCLGAWNVGEFIPHAFNYDLVKTNYPPDWFRGQPFLPWFKAYADEVRRISFMNRDSHELAEILIYYPQVSVWGQAEHIFLTDRVPEVMHFPSWTADAQQTESEYALLKLRLSEHRLAYQVADDHYLQGAAVHDARINIADSKFKLLCLAPMSTISRKTAQKIADFIDAGGHVIAIGQLPMNSTEEGREDPALRSLWESRFDLRPLGHGFSSKKNARGGSGMFTNAVTSELMESIGTVVQRDCEILDGEEEHLYALRKVKGEREFYWIVNDSAKPRTNMLRLRTVGKPERWDAQTGLRAPLFYQGNADHTIVRLKLDAWDAAYVVFEPAVDAPSIQLVSTDIDDFHITASDSASIRVAVMTLPKAGGNHISLLRERTTYAASLPAPSASPRDIMGDWQVTVDAPTIPVAFCQIVDDLEDKGLRENWAAKPEGALPWRAQWLSPATAAIKQWNLIGPFPNPGDDALDTVFPPESATDLHASYTGDRAQMLHWIAVDQAEYTIAPQNGNGDIGPVTIRGGSEDDQAASVNAGLALNLSPMHGTVYAQTFVYSSKPQRLKLLLATSAPRAVFLNQRRLHANWLRPFYNMLTDAFAESVELELNAGWNSVLLKFLYNEELPTGGSFYCRLAQQDGSPARNVIASNHQYEVSNTQENPSYRWLRINVPPPVGKLVKPVLEYPYKAFVDGRAAPSDVDIALPEGTKHLLLRVDGREVLGVPLVLQTATRPMKLGTWMQGGLEHFSGTMVYEKEVDISPAMLRQGLLLDCGTVGVVAEAWVNDVSVGSRAWGPFVFNLTKHVRPGRNRFKVRVANTEANRRAAGSYARILKNIDVDGWEGPARLVPFIQEEVVLHPSGATPRPKA
jgi:hypothetical protein